MLLMLLLLASAAALAAVHLVSGNNHVLGIHDDLVRDGLTTTGHMGYPYIPEEDPQKKA